MSSQERCESSTRAAATAVQPAERGPEALDFMQRGVLEAHRLAKRSKFQQPVMFSAI
jgi:hypothetical protein